MASMSFLLFYAETWTDLDSEQVDRLVERGVASANEQRRNAGKAEVPVDGWFSIVLIWWVTDRSGAFNPLRSYVESRAGYQRLLAVKQSFDEDDEDAEGNDDDSEDFETLWNIGIATAVAWIFVAHEKPLT